MALHPVNGLALCAGIGGLELGLRLAIGPSYRTVCYVEWEAHAAAVLVARMADKALGEVPVWDDLVTFDGRPWRGAVDIVSAGFPCQPFSTAGKRQGTADERWLWPHIIRIIGEARPGLVLLENVPGLITANNGQAFLEVLGDLAEMGYDAEWGVFSAANVGAPHLRRRVFILAALPDAVSDLLWVEPGWGGREGGEGKAEPGTTGEGTVLADAACECLDRAGADGTGRRGEHTGRRDGAVAHGHRGRQPESERTLGEERGRTDNCCEAVGHAPGRGKMPRELQGRWCELGEANPELGSADESGLQGRDKSFDSGPGELPLWPPRPADYAGWIHILDGWPQFAPAVESPLRRMVDGTTPRVDQFHALGNAVVPEVAALAFTVLLKRLVTPRWF